MVGDGDSRLKAAARVNRTSQATRFVQDMPPKGGYPHLNFYRQLPAKNISLLGVALGTAGIVMGGMYVSANGQVNRRIVRREQYDRRWQIIAVLQAEADRRWVLRRNDQYLEEYNTMRDVPGWKVDESPYHVKRYIEHAKPIGFFRERYA